LTDRFPHLTMKKLWLAPLAGYTDQPFRRICKECGADVMVSEMVSADGIIRKQQMTLAYLDFQPEEKPLGVQLFGSEPATLAQAAEAVLNYEFDFVDLNMGCPVKKVTKRGAGGALMADLDKSAKIVRAVRNILPSEFPLSVKFRSGIDFEHLNFLDFGKAVQDAGADFVILHPRTVKQGFTGSSNWEHISLLKQKLNIPVIGNGDIKSVADGLKMFEQTGCASVMIGRGALGQPWLFRQLKDAFAKEEITIPTPGQKLEIIFRHLDYFLAVKPEQLVVKEIRAHLCHYTKGLAGSAKLRDQINHTENLKNLKKILTAAFSAK